MHLFVSDNPDPKDCRSLVCSCGGAPFTPRTRAGRSPKTLLALVGQDAIKRGVARPLPAPEVEHGWYNNPAPVPDRRCAARRRDGSLCGQHYAMSDGRFCRFHSGQEPFTHAADLLDREAEERRIDLVVKQAAQITEFANALIDELGLDRKRVAGVLHRLAGGIDPVGAG